MFERFHRVEGIQGRTHEGTGIGLALVQELAKLHAGSVECREPAGLRQHVYGDDPNGHLRTCRRIPSVPLPTSPRTTIGATALR